MPTARIHLLAVSNQFTFLLAAVRNQLTFLQAAVRNQPKFILSASVNQLTFLLAAHIYNSKCQESTHIFISSCQEPCMLPSFPARVALKPAHSYCTFTRIAKENYNTQYNKIYIHPVGGEFIGYF
jgi:hypothetical protein